MPYVVCVCGLLRVCFYKSTSGFCCATPNCLVKLMFGLFNHLTNLTNHPDRLMKIPFAIIGSDRRPETKQGIIEGKIVRFRSGRVRDRFRVRDKGRRSESDCRSAAIN